MLAFLDRRGDWWITEEVGDADLACLLADERVWQSMNRRNKFISYINLQFHMVKYECEAYLSLNRFWFALSRLTLLTLVISRGRLGFVLGGSWG